MPNTFHIRFYILNSSPIASRSIFTSIQYSESEEDCPLNTILQTIIHIDGRWMVMLHVKLPTKCSMVG